jgi:signal transduction histidine kinase
VLVLHADRRDANIAILIDRELPAALERGLGERIDYYAEYIDLPRSPSPEYQPAFRDFLSLKYARHRFDVVVAINDEALAFVEQYRAELFPDTPIVFVSRRHVDHRLPNSTGVWAPMNFSGTLALATALQPHVTQVFVVSGASREDRTFETAARAQLALFGSRVAVTYLSGLPTMELEQRLATLPEHSVVYFLLVSQDGTGQNFHPLDYVERVAAVANAPVYCWVDSTIGRGVVGGSLLNQDREAASVARMTLSVLMGEPADSLPISSPDLYVAQVDWRQLRRWGISEGRVPSGTLVRFREPAAWERYRAYIAAAAALLLLQFALIAGLLVQRERRRRAEERAARSQAHLRASYERIRDLGGRLLRAQEHERARIARELHDDVDQQMTVLAVDLQLLMAHGQQARRAADRIAADASERVRAVISSIRDLSHHLHPATLRLIGLVPALARLVRDASTPGISIVFSHDEVPTLPDDLTLCLFRVVQEALQNAVRHSGATEVSVRLSGVGGSVILTIADNGVGFEVGAARGGLGLISMEERVNEIGGTLQIHSTPGAGGTRLEVDVPFTVAGLEARAV